MEPIKQKLGRSITKARAEAIDNILTFLFMSEERTDWTWAEDEDREATQVITAFNRVPLTHFDGADVSMMYESLFETTSYQAAVYWVQHDPDEEVGEDFRRELLSLPHDWDECVAGFFPEIPGMFPEIKATYLLSLLRHRTVPLKTVRGMFPLRSGFVLERSHAHLFNDGSYRSMREYDQYFANGWHVVGIPFGLTRPERLGVSDQNTIWLSRSLAMTREYDWQVQIGLNKKTVPTIAIPSDPLSARSIFKLRDVPPGKNRREVLRHWVSGHTRKVLEPNYAETYIWPYLRGAEEFLWQGLYCKIQPSQFDLKKAGEYQKMRGKHAGLVV